LIGLAKKETSASDEACEDENSSAGFRWWGAWGPGVVGDPMCGYKMFR